MTGRVQRILISYYALHNNIGMAMAMLIAHAQLGVVITCNREIELHVSLELHN